MLNGKGYAAFLNCSNSANNARTFTSFLVFRYFRFRVLRSSALSKKLRLLVEELHQLILDLNSTVIVP